MNIKELRNAAKEADVDVSKAPSFEEFKPKVGEDYVVRSESARAIKAKTGTPGVSVMLRVVDGPDGINRTIWANVYLAEGLHPNIVARSLHYLELFGIDLDSLEEVDFAGIQPGPKNGVDLVFEQSLVGLEPGYRKDKNDATKEWPNHHYVAVAGGGGARVVTEEAVEDDDLTWDD